MVLSNVPLGPGQPLFKPFFRRSNILEDIWDYRLKWVTVYMGHSTEINYNIIII